MTPEELLAEFDVLTDAPDGVQRLRELVLELAVRGKLGEQDPRDEPADQLLARIKEEQAQAAARSLRAVPSAKDHLPRPAFELPSGWVWANLGQVLLEVQAGWSPQCQNRPKEADEWGILKVSACSWGQFLPDENKAVLTGTTPRPDIEVKAGDLVVSRANTVELVARSVVVRACPPRLMLSDKTLRLVPSRLCSVEYLNLANLSDPARRHYAEEASGTSLSMRNVSQGVIAAAPIPLPPAAEQHRIVARVNAVTALLDQLEASKHACEDDRIAARDAALAALRNADDAEAIKAAWGRVARHSDDFFTDPGDVAGLRQAILELAVRGRLVRQDPSDEPARSLLERIAAEKTRLVRAGIIRTPKPLPPSSNDEALFPVPVAWAWSRIGEFTRALDYGSSAKSSEKGSVPVLRMGNLQRGEIDWTELKFTDDATEIEQYRLAPGTVLFNRTNSPALVGKTSIYRGGRTAVFAGYLIRVDLLPGVFPEYVNLWMNSPFARAWCERSRQDGVSQSNISAAKLATLHVPVPPLAEQHRIVARVDELLGLLDGLEARLAAARTAHAAFAAAAVHHLDL